MNEGNRRESDRDLPKEKTITQLANLTTSRGKAGEKRKKRNETYRICRHTTEADTHGSWTVDGRTCRTDKHHEAVDIEI